MRSTMFAVASLILAATGCSDVLAEGADVQNSDSASSISSNTPINSISVAEHSGSCTFVWDGINISKEDIVIRAVVSLENAIEAKGGIENMTPDDLPTGVIVSKSDQPFECSAMVLNDLKRAGYASVALQLQDEKYRQPANLLVPIGESGVEVAFTELNGTGQFFWSGEETMLPEISQKAKAFGPIEFSRREIVLRVDHSARFDRVYEVLGEFEKSGSRISITKCNKDEVVRYLSSNGDLSDLPTC